MPKTAMACGNKTASTQQTECSKEKMEPQESKKKECCGAQSKSKENKKTCNGKCGHSGCSTTSAPTMAFMIFEAIIPMNCFDFSIEKQKIYTTTGILSEGYSSLWCIPKIG